MKLLTKTIHEQLLRNGRIRQALEEDGRAEADFLPVVKLFTPDAGCTWLLTELDPDDPDIAFGLCDLGMGFPELGSVRISELESAAWNEAAITENPASLEQVALAAAGGAS